jgi:rhodanese-related sulfurtransferase
MHMKTKRMFWTLALFLALGLAACGGDDGKKSDVTADDVATTDVVEDLAAPEETVGEEDTAEETRGETDEFALLVDYLENGNGNYINVGAPKVINAADVVADGLENWVILDIRDKDKYGADEDGVWSVGPNEVPDFEEGHIPGAISVKWNEVVTYAEENLTTEDKILVVCYTGQQAGQSVVELNLLGYDAYSLKWGMSAWNKVFDLWSANTGNDWAGQFTTDPDEGKNEPGDFPALETGKTTGEEILRARIDAFNADNPDRIITPADLFAAIDDYYVINYWPEAEYLDPGHIAGSHQYTPLGSLQTSADLATLPTDKPIAVYCYSGQHGAQVATFLTLLGYDAWDVKFGTNAMIYDQMTKKQWTGPGDYAFEGVQPVEKAEFDILVEYLEGEGGDYINAGAPKVVNAADVVAEGLENWVILDIRDKDKYGPDGNGDWTMGANGTADFEEGHIPGAVSVAWNAVVTYAEENLTKEDKILVVCYTGQQAGQAVVILNLLGYDAYSLKWGMSAWNEVFDLWTANTGNDYAGQFTTDPDEGKNDPGDYPLLETGKTTGEEILRARIDAFNADNKVRIVTPADFFAAIDDYYVINYWPEAEYLDPGHIVGSHQYTPLSSLHTAADLATLPTDQPIAVYCYSGQHGAQVATWLTLLGYDAWDVKFGTNVMIYDQMTKKQWTGPGEYEFVTGE